MDFHIRVPPERWCITKAEFYAFVEEVRDLWTHGQLHNWTAHSHGSRSASASTKRFTRLFQDEVTGCWAHREGHVSKMLSKAMMFEHFSNWFCRNPFHNMQKLATASYCLSSLVLRFKASQWVSRPRGCKCKTVKPRAQFVWCERALREALDATSWWHELCLNEASWWLTLRGLHLPCMGWRHGLMTNITSLFGDIQSDVLSWFLYIFI